MTTNTITVQDLVSREVIYCVSSLIYSLTHTEKSCPRCNASKFLDEDLAISLWEGSINYDDAEYAINQDGSYLGEVNNLWGLYDNDDKENPIIDYQYSSKEKLISFYFDDMGWELSDYRSEVFEHWLVSSWLANKLEAYGETVVRDFYGLTVWGRTTTGQSIYCDWVIKQIYNDLNS